MKIRYIFLPFIAVTAMTSLAQDLSKEITVNKDIVPQEREASRMTVLPQLSLPAISQSRLNWSDKAVAAPITTDITLLPPAAYGASIAKSPYRGYLMAGYFPTFQLGVSAGYRIMDTDNTILNSYIQYNGSDYKGAKEFGSMKYSTHDARIGADIAHEFNGIGSLNADFAYSFSSTKLPWLTHGIKYNKAVNDVAVNVGWVSSLDKFDYSLGVGYDFIGLADPSFDLDGLKAMKNTVVNLDADLGYAINEKSSVRLDYRYAHTDFNNFMNIDLDPVTESVSAAVAPKWAYHFNNLRLHYLLSSRLVDLDLGAGVMNFGGGFKKTRVFPDVAVTFKASDNFAVKARYHGGDPDLGSVKTRWQQNRYYNLSQLSGPAWFNHFVDVAMRIGPFSGASFEAWVSYATMDECTMPATYYNGDVTGTMPWLSGASYNVADFTHMSWGVAFSYKYRSLLGLNLTYEGAPADFDKGNAFWFDRAKTVVTAGITVTPFDALDLGVKWQMRSGRCVYEVGPVPSGLFGGVVVDKQPYKSVNNLGFTANYRLNERVGLFANLDNMLGRRWECADMVSNAGFTGMVGVSLKF